jgi:hypothetical protein
MMIKSEAAREARRVAVADAAPVRMLPAMPAAPPRYASTPRVRLDGQDMLVSRPFADSEMACDVDAGMGLPDAALTNIPTPLFLAISHDRGGLEGANYINERPLHTRKFAFLSDSVSGELQLGGYDRTSTAADMVYVAATSTTEYSVNVQSLTFGGIELLDWVDKTVPNAIPAIMDTGTTCLVIPDTKLGGRVVDKPFSKFKSIMTKGMSFYITIDGHLFEIPYEFWWQRLTHSPCVQATPSSYAGILLGDVVFQSLVVEFDLTKPKARAPAPCTPPPLAHFSAPQTPNPVPELRACATTGLQCGVRACMPAARRGARRGVRCRAFGCALFPALSWRTLVTVPGASAEALDRDSAPQPAVSSGQAWHVGQAQDAHDQATARQGRGARARVRRRKQVPRPCFLAQRAGRALGATRPWAPAVRAAAPRLLTLPMLRSHRGTACRHGIDHVPVSINDMRTEYFVNVSVGSPRQSFTVLIDTGSSTLAIFSKLAPTHGSLAVNDGVLDRRLKVAFSWPPCPWLPHARQCPWGAWWCPHCGGRRLSPCMMLRGLWALL